MAVWYPDAIRQPLPDSGPPLDNGEPKGLLHTTEGATYPGVVLYHGTQPHFTCDIKRRKTYQHIAINRSAMALRHPYGTGQTNRDNVVQIECVGFTFGNRPESVSNWTSGDIAYLAELMRWIEHNAGVPRQAGVSFSHPVRLTGPQWDAYSGWCGHVHCPFNDHVDGTGMPIGKLLGPGGVVPSKPSPGHPTLRKGATGEAVHHLQATLRALGYKLAADGVFGPATLTAVKRFQKSARIQVDGVAGAMTWSAIHKAVRKRSQ